VIPRNIRLLAPCEHPLPTEHQPIEDLNLRFQRRYVDMLCNRDGVEALKIRSVRVFYFVLTFNFFF
jgi:lysyl-tRNA synthetase class II